MCLGIGWQPTKNVPSVLLPSRETVCLIQSKTLLCRYLVLKITSTHLSYLVTNRLARYLIEVTKWCRTTINLHLTHFLRTSRWTCTMHRPKKDSQGTWSRVTGRGVSSCSSLGWPHLYLGAKNSGWHNTWLYWLSKWCNLTPAMRCSVVVLVLQESLRTKFKSWSWSLSLRL